MKKVLQIEAQREVEVETIPVVKGSIPVGIPLIGASRESPANTIRVGTGTS